MTGFGRLAASWETELVSTVGDALAQFRCRVEPRRPGTGGAAIDIDVLPDHPAAASIWINASPGDVYLLMGAGCGVELGDAPIGEVVSIVKAVADGGFTEQVWFNRPGEIRASIGTVEVGGVVRKFYRNRSRDGTGGQVLVYSAYEKRGRAPEQ